MKRSGSRLLTKARSLRNIAKNGYRFRYKLTIEQVDKLTTNSDVCIVWERGTKVISTNGVKVSKGRVAKFGNAILEQEVTLFKRKTINGNSIGSNNGGGGSINSKKGGGLGFDEKVYRLSVKNATNDQFIGKIHLDFATYAGLPSSSRRVGAQLSHGGQLILTIESVFIEEVVRKKRTKGKTGDIRYGNKSDTLSEVTDTTDDESTFGEADVGNVNDLEGLGIEDDLSDLDVGESDGRQKQVVRTRVKQGNERRKMSDSGDNSNLGFGKSDALPRRNRKANRNYNGTAKVRSDMVRNSDMRSPSRNGIRPSQNRVIAEGSTHGSYRANGSMTNVDGGNWGSGRAPLISDDSEDATSELRRLRSENRKLRQRNEELSGGDGGRENRAVLMKLTQENKRLRDRVADLEFQMKREPAYHEVVRDLKEAKMALALLNLEKEELHHNAAVINSSRYH